MGRAPRKLPLWVTEKFLDIDPYQCAKYAQQRYYLTSEHSAGGEKQGYATPILLGINFFKFMNVTTDHDTATGQDLIFKHT